MLKSKVIDRQYKAYWFIAGLALSYLYYVNYFTLAYESIQENGMYYFFNRILWIIIIVINFSIYKLNFSYSKASKIFMAGIALWLLWGFFITTSGLSVFGVYGDIFHRFRNLLKIFLIVNIITIYDQKIIFLRVILFCLGTLLLFMFVMHFNGFAFLSSVSNVLNISGRNRYSYGFVHVNFAGMMSFHYLTMLAIYKALIEEKTGGGIDIFYLYFLAVTPAVIIILLASASRSAITALMFFYGIYWLQASYDKTKLYTKIIFMMVIILAACTIAFIIYMNWQAVYKLSGRMLNYAVYLPLLTQHRAWLTGMGFLSAGNFITASRITSIGFLDSFYLTVLLQSGIIGLAIILATMFFLAFSCFQENSRMTKSQKLIGGLFVALLWRALFESTLFGAGTYDTECWVLIILALNEKSFRKSIKAA